MVKTAVAARSRTAVARKGIPAAPTRTVQPAAVTLSPEGIVTAIVAVTGVVDQVADLIVPGAFTRTLAIRRPKVVFHHQWTEFVGRVLHIEEWLPGDPRLPKTTKDGKPWPSEAGALVATMQFNLNVQSARDVWEWVRFYSQSNECEFSIGYKVVKPRTAKRRDGVRVIYDLDVFELSLVLFGAASQTMTLEVKDGQAVLDDLFFKTVALPSVVDQGSAMQALMEAKAAADPTAGPKVAGLAVLAADTGRVLMLQRALTHNDEAAGTWEFPGGHLDDGEPPAAGAAREWVEETGLTLPPGKLADTYDSPNGVYRLHAYVIPVESTVALNPDQDDRVALNPDDPQGAMPEVTAWWDLRHAQANPALRSEVQDNTDWSALAGLVGGKVGDDLEAKSAAYAVREAKTLAASMEVKDGGYDRNEGNAENLRHWYVDGAGAAEIAWGAPGDFDRCVALAAKHMTPDNAKGYCNLRHHEALGIYPATHAAMDRLESKQMDMQGSYEQTRDLIQTAVRDLFNKDASDSYYCCVEATYPTYVIVTCSSDDEDGPKSYSIPYQVDDGAVALGSPTEVQLSVVASPVDDEETAEATPDDETAEVRFVAPAAAMLADAASYVALAPEGKDLGNLRVPLLRLLDALAAKGMDVSDYDSAPSGDDEDPWAGLLRKDENDDMGEKGAGTRGYDDSEQPAVDAASTEPDLNDAAETTDTDPHTEGASTADVPAEKVDDEDATDGGADDDVESADGTVTLDPEQVQRDLASIRT